MRNLPQLLSKTLLVVIARKGGFKEKKNDSQVTGRLPSSTTKTGQRQ